MNERDDPELFKEKIKLFPEFNYFNIILKLGKRVLWFSIETMEHKYYATFSRVVEMKTLCTEICIKAIDCKIFLSTYNFMIEF